MGFEIFGFQINRKKKEELKSVVAPIADDGSIVLSSAAAAYYVQTIDMDTAIKNENDLIRRYREISIHPECDAAVDDIVNEAISANTEGNIADLNLDNLEVSEKIKNKIHEEFLQVKSVMDFNVRAPDLFRSWYIDGRQYHVVTLDPENPKAGIQSVEMVDSRKIRKIRRYERKVDPVSNVEIVHKTEEFFIYNERGIEATSTQGVKLSVDSVVYLPSGLFDQNSATMFSHLHKAIRPVNQLKMLEDAVVINTIARAPERRIFYIDVGNMPRVKAEQYVTDIMNKYRNRVIYDASTGEVRDNRRHMCLSMDTLVPLLDGRKLTLSEIAVEYEAGKQLWAYSCDPITGKFAPGKITWAGVSRPDAQVLRITLDNGKTITCTPDHKFPVWNKGLVKAADLCVGESMIPHYTKAGKVKKNASTAEYERIFSNDTGKWEFTHQLVSRWKDSQHILNEQIFVPPEYTNRKKITIHHAHRNHKIANIEYLEERIDTGCLTIDGDEEFHDYHTFAVDAGIYVGNSMLEDFWMPRRDGGKGTEITTLPGSGQLLNNEMIMYFQQKLYQSLNVPISRLLPQQNFTLGRTNEITREELKFNKFVTRLRGAFGQLLIDLLKIQLIAKNIIAPDDWQEFEKKISIKYTKDNNFVEMRDAELWSSRFTMLQQIEPFINKFVSHQWVLKNVLRLSDEEVLEMKKEIKEYLKENPPQDGFGGNQDRNETGDETGQEKENDTQQPIGLGPQQNVKVKATDDNEDDEEDDEEEKIDKPKKKVKPKLESYMQNLNCSKL